MKPVDTKYRLMQPEDRKAVEVLMGGSENGRHHKLGWPTVVAERDGKVVGMLSTGVGTDAVQAGPLRISEDVTGIVAMRLVEAYENVLRLAGVSTYVFYVAKKNEHYMNQVVRLGFTPYRKTKTNQWFIRHIGEQP